MKYWQKIPVLFLAVLLSVSILNGQAITNDIPEKIDPTSKYLFYLHGGIVGTMGPENAVSEYYGRYEYQKILDSLANKGFRVIAEVRPKDTKIGKYAAKLKKQINKLIKAGVPQKNITVVGASMGAYIAIETAHKVKKKNVKYALLGLCSSYAVDYYARFKGKLPGNFLSIYEASDEKKSCKEIFSPLNNKARFQEIKLEMGNSHAFLYKPFDDWVLPLEIFSKNMEPDKKNLVVELLFPKAERALPHKFEIPNNFDFLKGLIGGSFAATHCEACELTLSYSFNIYEARSMPNGKVRIGFEALFDKKPKCNANREITLNTVRKKRVPLKCGLAMRAYYMLN